MSRAIVAFALLVVCTSAVFADVCKVTSQTYSAQDGLVITDVAHIITFVADCPPNVVPAYANLNGRTLTVVRNENDKKYQVSWITELSKSSSGSYNIAIFDEEGHQQFKKSQRTGSSDAKALFSVEFNHSSPYKGPFFQPELVVLLGGLVISYFALVYRCKIVAKKI